MRDESIYKLKIPSLQRRSFRMQAPPLTPGPTGLPAPRRQDHAGTRPMRETHNSRIYGHFHDWGVISLFIPFQPFCQLIYIASIAHQFQINILAPDAEQHPVVPNSLAIKPMKRRLEPDHVAFERVIPHSIKVF